MGTRGYDCLVIPGAKVGTASAELAADAAGAEKFCGESKGLNSAAGGVMTASQTICCKSVKI